MDSRAVSLRVPCLLVMPRKVASAVVSGRQEKYSDPAEAIDRVLTIPLRFKVHCFLTETKNENIGTSNHRFRSYWDVSLCTCSKSNIEIAGFKGSDFSY